MDKFWCCFVEGTGGFSYKHLIEGDARIEAERLAKMPQNHRKKVYILKPIGFCRTAEPQAFFYPLSEGV